MATLITDVKVVLTAPEGINLLVVKVETNQPGLVGLGCGTFAYRHLAVKCLVEEYLKPQRRFAHLFSPQRNSEAIARIQVMADHNIRKFNLADA